MVLAAVVPANQCPKDDALSSTCANNTLLQLPLPCTDSDLPLFDYPHDVVRHHLTTLRENLEHRLKSGHHQELAAGVFAAPGARLGQYVVTDTSQGPIVLEKDASVGPYCYMSGPAYLGGGSPPDRTRGY